MIDRIKHVMEHYQFSPASFAEQIGINRSNLTHLFSGRNQPSLDLAKKILHCFPEIKTEWLIMGVGQMFRNEDERELNIQLQKEKLKQISHPEPDLFNSVIREKINIPPRITEEKEPTLPVREVEKQILPNISTPVEVEAPPSHSTVLVNKIVFFYSDNSFELFHPK